MWYDLQPVRSAHWLKKGTAVHGQVQLDATSSFYPSDAVIMPGIKIPAHRI